MEEAAAAAPKRFAVTAALTRAELDAYAAWAQAQVTSLVPVPGWWQPWLIGGVLALLGALAAVLLGTASERRAGTVAALVFLAYSAGVYVWHIHSERYWDRVRQVYRAFRDERLTQAHSYGLNDEGITADGGLVRYHASWAAFTDVEASDGLLLLCTSRSTAMAIPVRAFFAGGGSRGSRLRPGKDRGGTGRGAAQP